MHLIIDGGKSKTAAMLIDPQGTVLRRAAGPGLEIITTPHGVAAVTKSLEETLAMLDLPPHLHTVSFGLNGVHAPDSGVSRAVAAISGLLSADRYVIASDVVMSFVGALGICPGVVVAAGTGSITLAVGQDGTSARIDGHGPLLGDRGSGYDIGSRGLKDALQFADGLPGSAVLHEELIGRFGSAQSAVAAVYSSENPSKVIASFSKEVGAAARNGDETAVGLWELAGKELATSAAVAASQAGLSDAPFRVSSTGGLFKVGELLQAPFERELRRLAPQARHQEAAGHALDGAAALALRSEPVLTELSAWITADSQHAGRASDGRS